MTLKQDLKEKETIPKEFIDNLFAEMKGKNPAFENAFFDESTNEFKKGKQNFTFISLDFSYNTLIVDNSFRENYNKDSLPIMLNFLEKIVKQNNLDSLVFISSRIIPGFEFKDLPNYSDDKKIVTILKKLGTSIHQKEINVLVYDEETFKNKIKFANKVENTAKSFEKENPVYSFEKGYAYWDNQKKINDHGNFFLSLLLESEELIFKLNLNSDLIPFVEIKNITKDKVIKRIFLENPKVFVKEFLEPIEELKEKMKVKRLLNFNFTFFHELMYKTKFLYNSKEQVLNELKKEFDFEEIEIFATKYIKHKRKHKISSIYTHIILDDLDDDAEKFLEREIVEFLNYSGVYFVHNSLKELFVFKNKEDALAKFNEETEKALLNYRSKKIQTLL